MIQLRHDPNSGALPAALTAGSLRPTPADFHAEPGACCPRCGNDLCQHVWQVVDPDMVEQGGVIDCGSVREAA